METFLIYIGKTALAVGAFYLTFYFLFRTQSLFRFNRFYLLSSFLISFIIPLITFTVVEKNSTSTFHQISNYNVFFPPNETLMINTVKDNLDIALWCFYLYFIGVGISIAHLIIGHIRAKSLISKSYKEINYSTEFCVSKEDIHPFSFFNKIIVPKKILTHPNLDLIIQHENVHVKEKHTLDMLFAELLFTFQWFNPFAWLIKDAIKTNLEYIADNVVIKTTDVKTYQFAMVSLADKKGIAPFLTALNGSQLKNRIIMMKQKTENKKQILRKLVTIPLVTLLVLTLSNKEFQAKSLLDKEITISGKVLDQVSLKPISGASVIIKGRPVGTITDEEGNFTVTVEPDDNSLIFAHQGFTRKEVKITDKPSIVVKLTTSEKEPPTPKNVNDKKIEQEKWKRTIYGKVSDKKTGEPIPNASVLIKGERIGTITDQTGSYMIKIDDSDKNVILIFSNIGYDINETKIQNKDEVNVTLKKNE